MQLGTRWAVGAAAPDRIPQPVRAAIRTVEAELEESDQPTAGWSWTLTFLEGKPIVDLDDGTRIRLVDDDVALVTSVELDDSDDED
jgi:predicted secreted protein